MRKRDTSRTVLLVLGVFLLIFVAVMTAIFCVKGSVPDTLIECTMGTGGLEAVALSAIKVSRIWKGEESV